MLEPTIGESGSRIPVTKSGALSRLPLFGVRRRCKSLVINPPTQKVCTTATFENSQPQCQPLKLQNN